MQNNFQIISASVSDRGLSEKRPENEDSFLEIKKSGIFAVADGVGGAQAGDVASQMAMEIVGEAFVNMASPGDSEDIMKVAIERANEAIFQMSNELPQLSTMATTIVALHVNGSIATIGHVGDSRLYRIDSNGTLYRETQDHSVVEEEVRAGRMTPEQAANHPSRNIISRALGAEPSVEVDLKTIMFEPNTTFLICSDGITRHISDDEINALLFSAHQPSEICQRMKEICYSRGAEDNLTAVIVRVLEASADTQIPSDDFEQDTVATARQPMPAATGISSSAAVENAGSSNETVKQNLETQNLTGYATVAAAQPKVDTTSSYIGAPEGYNFEKPKTEETTSSTVSTYENENSGGGLFGKLIGGIALLLLGILIGAGGYSLFKRQQVVEEPTPIVQSPPDDDDDIDFSGFEKNRRNVDNDPAQFIKTFQTKPSDAEDYYLLGRAHLLTKNYAEAKKNFIEAKNRLATVSNGNSKILATEIATGLAVINDPFALREFEKEMPNVNPKESNTNSNVTVTQTPSG